MLATIVQGVEQGNIVGCRDGHTSQGNVPKSGKGKGKGKRKGDAEFGKTKPAAEPDPLPTKKARLSKDAICHLRNCKLYWEDQKNKRR
jgi:hypothetical protein